MRIEKLKISHKVMLGSILLLFLVMFTVVLSTKAATGTYLRDIKRVSVTSSGGQANASSYFSYTSEDGRYVTFGSHATNLVPGDGDNGYVDAFLHDTVTGQTQKITYSDGGGETDHDSHDPIITADGRYISYASFATNLVPGDTNGSDWTLQGLDVFVYDRQTGATNRVSLTESGNQISGNSTGVITPDGKHVIFFSSGGGVVANAIYKRNLSTGTLSRLTRNVEDGYGGNSYMVHVWSDYDASHVVFSSNASNLVHDDNNGLIDIFLYTASDGITRRISTGYNGSEANGMSGQPFISMDGRFVVYRSAASNLVPNDTNGEKDIFLYNVETGQTTRVNVDSNGHQANGTSRDPSICKNGRYVSYTSDANYLVPNDNNNAFDVFLYDKETRETILVSKSDSGVIGNERAHRSFLVPDCSGIVFASDATNFVPNDTNNSRDMYMSQIATPPDLSRTSMSCSAAVSPGDTVQHSITFVNDGTDTGGASLVSPIPTEATVITNSLSAGLTYNEIDQQIEWNGTVAGKNNKTLGYSLQMDDGLVGPTAVSSIATWTADGTQPTDVFCATVIDGIPTYLPIVNR